MKATIDHTDSWRSGDVVSMQNYPDVIGTVHVFTSARGNRCVKVRYRDRRGESRNEFANQAWVLGAGLVFRRCLSPDCGQPFRTEDRAQDYCPACNREEQHGVGGNLGAASNRARSARPAPRATPVEKTIAEPRDPDPADHMWSPFD